MRTLVEMTEYEQFDNVYRYPLPHVGVLRLAPNGMAWKAKDSQISEELSRVFPVRSDELKKCVWVKATKGYRLKLTCQQGETQELVKFDNFQKEDFNRIKDSIKLYYRLTLEVREICLKGWNWGKTDFQGNMLTFQAQNKPVFELPLEEVTNTSVNGKEVGVEFTVGSFKKTDARYKEDHLLEIKFYVPGGKLPGTRKRERGDPMEEDEEGSVEKGGEGAGDEEEDAARLLFETIKQRADVGIITGEALATFPDQLCLLPRGRFSFEFYPDSIRLRGKTYDYRIKFDQIKMMFMMPKPDDVHMFFVFGLDPAIRQGQTRYPWVIFQFSKDDWTDLDLNISTEDLEDGPANRVKKSYYDHTYKIIADLMNDLGELRMEVPGAFKSKNNQKGLKCSLKANEGFLYPMETHLVFIPKPPLVFAWKDINQVSFSRLSTTSSSEGTRTFDLKVVLKSGVQHQLSSLNREEYASLVDFLRSKDVRIVKDSSEQSLSYRAMEDESSGEESDLPRSSKRARSNEGTTVTGGDDDDDEESVDEDFVAKSSESEVEEEYDSQAAPPSEDGDED